MHVDVAANQDNVKIIDLALERAIRESLDIHDRPLTKDDLASLTTLRAVGKGISDLSGIEHASELTKLVLGANNINDLSPLTGYDLLGTRVRGRLQYAYNLQILTNAKVPSGGRAGSSNLLTPTNFPLSRSIFYSAVR